MAMSSRTKQHRRMIKERLAVTPSVRGLSNGRRVPSVFSQIRQTWSVRLRKIGLRLPKIGTSTSESPRGCAAKPAANCFAHCRDLSNAQWEILKSLIPEPISRKDGRGRPWKDRRTVLNGILWVLRTGAPWADVPDRYLPTKPVIAGFSNGFAPEQ